MKIPLEEIRSATRDFTIPRKPGKVYMADLSHFNVDKYVAENKIKRVSIEEILEYPKRKSTVAIKSIDGGYGQRTKELLQTLLYLSHENIVKLVGFCDEDDERIHVVYEYASNGSLDEYIHSQHIIKRHKTVRNVFPWVMRLQFCLEAARGLNFLHNGNRKNHTIIHGNIKSSNILISQDGVGMIGDFGLSTYEYSDTHKLTKEYDVYSFGLVLFEVLSGALTDFEISEDDPKFLPDIVKRGFNQKELDNIIDPMLRQEFWSYRSLIGNRSAESLNMFANIAYRCFHEKAKGRPTMADIVEELEKAYNHHVKSLEQRQEDEDNSKMYNLGHLKIPFKEIYSATNGFVDSCMIGWGGFGGVYRAELFHVDVRKYVGKEGSLIELYGYPRRKGKVAIKRREITSDQGRKELWKEIDVLSGLNHPNIISLVGFCYEYGEMIIIYDYASNGSFENYIQNIQNLTWKQRLQICIDAAHGLNYLHNHHIIHCDVKSHNILLGGSLEGIIGDVGLSKTIGEGDFQLFNINPVGTPGYIDPKYLKRGILSKQSDMYSFGVVLLEVLCGRFARPSATRKDRASLVDWAESHLSNNQSSQIIGDYLRKDLANEKLLDSVKMFAAITHECLHSTETHRLAMADVLKELKKALAVHLIGVETILLEDIKSATDGFRYTHVIGRGPSGTVYKGELTLFKKSIPVAVKRLHRARFNGEGAFLKEVVKLSSYVHENIITLRGYCEEGDEKIIIEDYAINGSLDNHLHNSTLTWGLRLKISIGAAKGINYIHSAEEDQKTVHGDIKSSNILLDHDWKASISDFIIPKPHGTKGYLDPHFTSSGVATKEGDVYSFGVVLFELLSGKLAIDKVIKYLSHPTLRQIIEAGDGVKDMKNVNLTWMVECCFEKKKVHALIFDDIMKQTDVRTVDIVSEVAYKCLQKDQEQRPTMALVIQELEKALSIHDEWGWERKVPKDYEKILKMTQHPVSPKITKKDLYFLFSSGILLQNGKLVINSL
ncbi:phloem protein 2-like protein [Tanacetum coccineum]